MTPRVARARPWLCRPALNRHTGLQPVCRARQADRTGTRRTVPAHRAERCAEARTGNQEETPSWEWSVWWTPNGARSRRATLHRRGGCSARAKLLSGVPIRSPSCSRDRSQTRPLSRCGSRSTRVPAPPDWRWSTTLTDRRSGPPSSPIAGKRSGRRCSPGARSDARAANGTRATARRASPIGSGGKGGCRPP
jgi:hypothetical protein